MEVTLHSTDRIVELAVGPHGVLVPARVWEGQTGRGITVHAYITRIAVARADDASQFEQELIEVPVIPISKELAAAIPYRLIIP